MQIRSIGIDLGKTIFHLVALGSRGKVVVRKKLSRQQLLLYTANLPSSLIGMEACVGSHFLGRVLREQGHEVRLIPAQFMRPFVKSNKNDYRDAEFIAEAEERENMRFVPIKTEDQLDVQALHRVRERLVSRRTSVINQIRAFLLERGISFRKGQASLVSAIGNGAAFTKDEGFPPGCGWCQGRWSTGGKTRLPTAGSSTPSARDSAPSRNAGTSR